MNRKMEESYLMCIIVFLNIYASRANQDDFNYGLPCGESKYSDEEPRIVGGVETKPNEFPWLVSIKAATKKGYKQKCGGTIINRDFILTAAHCFSDIPEEEILIMAGAFNVEKNEEHAQTRSIQKIFLDSYDDNTFKNDIALIKLNDSLELEKEYVAPCCIPTGGENFGDKRVSAGWGLISENSRKGVDKTRKVTLDLLDDRKCMDIYKEMGYNELLHKGQICTLTPDKDTCQGDSGGPLMGFNMNDKKNYICGVVSWGADCETSPGVYSNVTYFADWIMETVENNS